MDANTGLQIQIQENVTNLQSIVMEDLTGVTREAQ